MGIAATCTTCIFDEQAGSGVAKLTVDVDSTETLQALQRLVEAVVARITESLDVIIPRDMHSSGSSAAAARRTVAS